MFGYRNVEAVRAGQFYEGQKAGTATGFVTAVGQPLQFWSTIICTSVAVVAFVLLMATLVVAAHRARRGRGGMVG